MTHLSTALCLLLFTAGLAPAQHAHPPMRSPSPLLFVRFQGPAGARATFYQGRAAARSFNAPVAVGLRTGYLYRVRLDHFHDVPGVVLFPTLEVHGALQLGPKMSAADFPVAINLSREDIDAVVAGAMVTKVFYLEHPDRAEPRATRPGEVIEIDVPRSGNILHEARQKGRVMVVMHLGGRQPTMDELVATNVPGTILFPGERSVGLAAAPPVLKMATWPFFDPKLGPRPPEEECLHDGGDRGIKAGLDNQGQLGGLDPEDTLGEYTDSRGRKHVVCSTRVCLCVPRYVALRKLIPLAAAEGSLWPGLTSRTERQGLVDSRLPPNLASRTDILRGLHARQRPTIDTTTVGPGLFKQVKVLFAEQLTVGPIERIAVLQPQTLRKEEHLVLLKALEFTRSLSVVTGVAGTESLLGTAVVARVKGGPEVIETVLSTRDLTVCCGEKPIVPPDRPLVLVKCADRGSAQVGDLVTFTLRYSNVGGRPLTDVAVTDSLSGRLEYVEGSTQADRDAVFTMRPNEAGSMVLRWEISGTLQPGETGRIRFKVRVR